MLKIKKILNFTGSLFCTVSDSCGSNHIETSKLDFEFTANP
jgi:hypothetical protein